MGIKFSLNSFSILLSSLLVMLSLELILLKIFLLKAKIYKILKKNHFKWFFFNIKLIQASSSRKRGYHYWTNQTYFRRKTTSRWPKDFWLQSESRINNSHGSPAQRRMFLNSINSSTNKIIKYAIFYYISSKQ